MRSTCLCVRSVVRVEHAEAMCQVCIWILGVARDLMVPRTYVPLVNGSEVEVYLVQIMPRAGVLTV